MRTRWLVLTVVAALAVVGVFWTTGLVSKSGGVGEPFFDVRSAPAGAPGPVRVEAGTQLAGPVVWDGRSWVAALIVTGEPATVLDAYRRQLVEHWLRKRDGVRTDPVPVGPVTTRHAGDGVIHGFTTLNDGTYVEDDSYTFDLVDRGGEARLYVRAGHRE